MFYLFGKIENRLFTWITCYLGQSFNCFYEAHSTTSWQGYLWIEQNMVCGPDAFSTTWLSLPILSLFSIWLLYYEMRLTNKAKFVFCQFLFLVVSTLVTVLLGASIVKTNAYVKTVLIVTLWPALAPVSEDSRVISVNRSVTLELMVMDAQRNVIVVVVIPMAAHTPMALVYVNKVI